jgi:hypothetical protein
MRTFRSAVELNRNFKTRKAIEELLEKSGHATNAFAGGKFNPKPVQSRWQKFGLLSSVVTGYIDLGLDLQVTVSWFNEGKRDLFALSVAAMLVPILIQWAFIDKSTSRRAQSFFQVKLAVDGWNSFNEEMVTPGFAAAKFAEGVYEASAEGILQMYDALNVLAVTGKIKHSLVISAIFSLHSMASVLLLFIDGWKEAEGRERGEERAQIGHTPFCKLKMVKRMRLRLYHIAEVGFRILSFAMLGFALNSLSFLVALGSLAIRFLVYYVHITYWSSKKKSTMSKSMVVASTFVDSVWDTRNCLTTASICTAIEGAAFAFVAYSKCSAFPGNGRAAIFIVLAAFFVVKSVLQVYYVLPMSDRGVVDAEDMSAEGKEAIKGAVKEAVGFDDLLTVLDM